MPEVAIRVPGYYRVPPAPICSAVAGGSIAASGTMYFSLIVLNQVGQSVPSPMVQVNFSAGNKITCQIPASIRQPGDGVHYVVLAASLTTSPLQLQPLAWYRATASNLVDNPLPYTFELSTPEHIAIGAVTSSPETLPVNPLNGQRRWVASLASDFYYDADSDAVANGQTVLAATTGRWHLWKIPIGIGSITAPTNEWGCNRDIRLVSPENLLIEPPTYSKNGEYGTGTRFLIAWGNVEGQGFLPKGRRVGVEITQGGANRTQAFNNRVFVFVEGVVRLATGAMVTSGLSVDAAFPLPGANQPAYFTEQDLPSGYAYLIRVRPKFRAEETPAELVEGGVIEALPKLLVQAGDRIAGGQVFGSLILSNADKRRIVPGIANTLTALRGSGIIATRDITGQPIGAFSFDVQPVTTLVLPSVESNDIKIVIANNGATYALQAGQDPNSVEALRAVVSTMPGVGQVSAWSSAVSVAAGASITITCSYPSNGTTAQIRANYPDVIAGMFAKLNATQVTLYLQNTATSEIRRFSGQMLIDGATQAFSISNWNLGSTIASLPVVDADFGLFAPGAVTMSAEISTTNIPAGTYRAAFAFEYPSGGIVTATKISHSVALGCMPEAQRDISSLLIDPSSGGGSSASSEEVQLLLALSTL